MYTYVWFVRMHCTYYIVLCPCFMSYLCCLRISLKDLTRNLLTMQVFVRVSHQQAKWLLEQVVPVQGRRVTMTPDSRRLLIHLHFTSLLELHSYQVLIEAEAEVEKKWINKSRIVIIYDWDKMIGRARKACRQEILTIMQKASIQCQNQVSG